MTAKAPRPPKHLAPSTRRWWASVVEQYILEEHDVRLLTLGAEHWDRAAIAREALASRGLTFVDRFGCPRERPEVKIAKESAGMFARLIRELRLDIEAPESRPPGLGAR